MWMEQVAQRSRLAKVEPACKIVVGLTGILAAWATQSFWVLGILVVMWTVLARGNMVRPPAAIFFLWGAPVAFLLLSCLLVAVEFSASLPAGVMGGVSFFSWVVWTDWVHLERVAVLFLRGLIGIQALVFIAGSTPVAAVESLLARLGVSAWLVDLMASIYRMVAVFAEQGQERARAILSRNGWSRWRHSLRCSGQWLTGLFVGALLHTRRANLAMAARCGSGSKMIWRREKAGFLWRDWGVTVAVVFAQWFLVMGGYFL